MEKKYLMVYISINGNFNLYFYFSLAMVKSSISIIINIYIIIYEERERETPAYIRCLFTDLTNSWVGHNTAVWSGTGTLVCLTTAAGPTHFTHM